MKKLLLFTISIFTILIIYYPQNITGSSAGSPGGKTNSPLDMFTNCTQCHTGSTPNSGGVNISITSYIPQTGYIPGETYTIITTINQSGSKSLISLTVSSMTIGSKESGK